MDRYTDEMRNSYKASILAEKVVTFNSDGELVSARQAEGKLNTEPVKRPPATFIFFKGQRTMGLAKNDTVQEWPVFVMWRWAILDIKGERHVIGYVPAKNYSRISSPVQSFDPEKLEAVTRTGRVYKLEKGHGGMKMETLYILGEFLTANGFSMDDVKDVTKEVVPDFACASSEEGEESM